MSNESKFNWKWLIPVYGLYVISKSEIADKNKMIVLNIVTGLIVMGIIGGLGEDGKTVSVKNNNQIAAEQGTDNSERTKPAKEETEEQKASEEKPAWKIGDTVKTEKFDIKVSSVTTRASVGGQFMSEKAADGALFLIVNFSYKNITKKPISSYSVPEVNIFDPNGTEYDEASGATIYYQTEINLNKKAISDINPGITQKDAAVFEVSRDLWKNKGWKLVVDADDDVEMQIK